MTCWPAARMAGGQTAPLPFLAAWSLPFPSLPSSCAIVSLSFVYDPPPVNQYRAMDAALQSPVAFTHTLVRARAADARQMGGHCTEMRDKARGRCQPRQAPAPHASASACPCLAPGAAVPGQGGRSPAHSLRCRHRCLGLLLGRLGRLLGRALPVVFLPLAYAALPAVATPAAGRRGGAVGGRQGRRR